MAKGGSKSSQSKEQPWGCS